MPEPVDPDAPISSNFDDPVATPERAPAACGLQMNPRSDADAGRARWRAYKAAGLEIKHHAGAARD